MERPSEFPAETYRSANDAASIRRSFEDNLHFIAARFPAVATPNDLYLALAWTVRDRLLRRWIDTAAGYYQGASRTLCYLSAEYLPGPHLKNALLCVGIEAPVREALGQLGLDLDTLAEQEPEPGLGNGGLGRLAACYLDSLATRQVPCIGYGIRYEFGIFEQTIRHGRQIERSDKWLSLGNAWEVPRPEISFEIGFGGETSTYQDAGGRLRVRWLPARRVKGVAYDTLIPGYGVRTVNMLRLWSAQACEEFDFQAFNEGDYQRAVEEKIASETISKVLYPNDEPQQGRRLRLEQQAFFAGCALQDMIRIHLQRSRDVGDLADRFTVQLNDTHPAVAVAELMRLLMDEHGQGWEQAWSQVRRMVGYTNHTLLPEALETWPVDLFGAVLPRHLEIVYEINQRFLDDVRTRWPGDEALVARLSLIDETGGRRVRMAHLAGVAAHHINGVAELHSRLLGETVLRDLHQYDPERFTNVTNGVSPRRFMALANPPLARLIDETIGPGWLADLERLRELEPYAEDAAFRDAWRAIKLANKQRLADDAGKRTGVAIEPHSLFDVQVKRLHEYKRQHLNILQVIARYLALEADPQLDVVPRTWIFAGKAAPGYRMAKLIIELIVNVARVINRDPRIGDRMRLVFLPNFNVKNALRIYAAADLSEQISTAGTEASGTGNMKLALNGALTIGTLDGANAEILDAVGEDCFFRFGLTAAEISARRGAGYRPFECYEREPRLRAALDAISDGRFSRGDRDHFRPLLDALLGTDQYFVLADFPDYHECQNRVQALWRRPDAWTRASILNTARCGRFSSDRAVAEYCERIWQVAPVAPPPTETLP